MDDVVLGHRSELHLATVYGSVCSLFIDQGIKLNPAKTKWTGTTLFFLGLEYREQGWTPSQDKLEKVKDLLHHIDTRVHYDPKVLQRLVGTLCFHAPFTRYGYALLKPLYHAITGWKDFRFVPAYKQLLLTNFTNTIPVRKIYPAYPQVFSDATPTCIAYVNYLDGAVMNHMIPTTPIFLAELLAAIWAVIQTQTPHLALDNTAVIARKFTRLPWSLGCVANAVLLNTHMSFVPTDKNPADWPSRGIKVLMPYPAIPKVFPATGKLSLAVFAQKQHVKANRKVHFRSPLLHSSI